MIGPSCRVYPWSGRGLRPADQGHIAPGRNCVELPGVPLPIGGVVIGGVVIGGVVIGGVVAVGSAA